MGFLTSLPSYAGRLISEFAPVRMLRLTHLVPVAVRLGGTVSIPSFFVHRGSESDAIIRQDAVSWRLGSEGLPRSSLPSIGVPLLVFAYSE